MESNEDLLYAFRMHLRAGKKSPKTIKNYVDSAQLLADHFGGKPLLDIGPRDIEAFIGDLAESRSASTAATRFRCLQQFYKWAASEAEGLVPVSPMHGLSAPAVPENPPDVLRDEQVTALLKACEGRGFTGRRDTALIRLMLIAGGPRLEEISNLQLDDVDAERMLITVVGKGSRPRVMPYSDRTAVAVSRYLRERRQHPASGSAWLWLGTKGRLTASGIAQALERRALAAGIGHLHPHMLRHTSADRWKRRDGANEEDMMRLFGWRSREMILRYGARVADERAMEAARRMAIDNDY
jgi:site-specific recombinase XerD